MDEPDNDEFYGMVRRFRAAARDGSLYASHRAGLGRGAPESS
jgi:hypothetical protein